MLMANVFLRKPKRSAFGKTAEEVKAEGTPDWLVPHRVFTRNQGVEHDTRFEALTPEMLGSLVALS